MRCAGPGGPIGGVDPAACRSVRRRATGALLALVAVTLAACSAHPSPGAPTSTAPAASARGHAAPPGGITQPITVQVRPGPTVTVVTASPPVAIVGQPVVLTATVTSAEPATGTVSFEDGGVPVAGCQNLPLPPSRPYVVHCTQSYGTVSTQVITAVYSGDERTAASQSAPYVLGVALPDTVHGYWTVASDGGVFSFGVAPFYGSMGSHPLNRPVVGMESTPDGRGYWLVASDGGIFSFGDAGFFGSTGGHPLNRPVVGMVATSDGRGYWLVASDGGVFAFGDARFYGSTGGIPLSQPVVGLAPTPDDDGYWLVNAVGTVVAVGDAHFYGSMGELPLNRPIVGITGTPDGGGYWLVASDGGVFAIGDAGFYGSLGATVLNAPMVGMAATADGRGYWLVASDGGVFALGDAGFFGSMGGHPLNRPMVGIAPVPADFVLP